MMEETSLTKKRSGEIKSITSSFQTPSNAQVQVFDVLRPRTEHSMAVDVTLADIIIDPNKGRDSPVNYNLVKIGTDPASATTRLTPEPPRICDFPTQKEIRNRLFTKKESEPFSSYDSDCDENYETDFRLQDSSDSLSSFQNKSLLSSNWNGRKFYIIKNSQDNNSLTRSLGLSPAF
jgi:hypothetical protein